MTCDATGLIVSMLTCPAGYAIQLPGQNNADIHAAIDKAVADLTNLGQKLNVLARALSPLHDALGGLDRDAKSTLQLWYQVAVNRWENEDRLFSERASHSVLVATFLVLGWVTVLDEAGSGEELVALVISTTGCVPSLMTMALLYRSMRALYP